MTATASHDAYLSARPADQQAVLGALRALIHRLVPGAEEVVSYAMPGFRKGSKVFAGYAGYARNCGFYPHSGNIIPQFSAELAALSHRHTPGAAQFTPAKPLPDDLVARLVAARLAGIAA